VWCKDPVKAKTVYRDTDNVRLRLIASGLLSPEVVSL